MLPADLEPPAMAHGRRQRHRGTGSLLVRTRIKRDADLSMSSGRNFDEVLRVARFHPTLREI